MCGLVTRYGPQFASAKWPKYFDTHHSDTFVRYLLRELFENLNVSSSYDFHRIVRSLEKSSGDVDSPGPYVVPYFVHSILQLIDDESARRFESWRSLKVSRRCKSSSEETFSNNELTRHPLELTFEVLPIGSAKLF